MQVGLLTRSATSPALSAGQAILEDGAWHMLTLSTLIDSTPGYAMFIDGALAAEMNGNQSYYSAPAAQEGESMPLGRVAA